MNGASVLAEKFGDVEMFRTCEQCGCCSSACPITGKEGFNVRRIVRHIELDLINEIAETPHPWQCTTCGRCESVCPNGIAILDIMRPLRGLAPDQYVPDDAPCKTACPGGIDVPGYIWHISQGKPEEAHRLIMDAVPLPGVLGRVCTHPCEEKCRRGEVNESISICALKRYAADKAGPLPKGTLKAVEENGQKVAVIGAGPAGLSCAYFLALKGYDVTIYEKLSVTGGMLSVGIPEFRLPRDIISDEIQVIQDMGVRIETGVDVGKDVTIEGLREQGYKAIFLGIGAQECKSMGIEGEELEGVYPGGEFLRRVNLGEQVELGKRIAVIGGGNVAMDAVRTAKRLGAGEAFVVYRRSHEEMPAIEEEIEECKEEGIEINILTNPTRIIGDNGKVKAIECVKMELREPDESGRRSPVPIKDSEFTIEVDGVIQAIGQESDWSCLGPECACTLTDWGTMNVDPVTLQTDDPDIFAGGDAVTGPRTVIEAIGAGKQAAKSIDRFLGGNGELADSGIGQQPIEASDPVSRIYDGKREKGFADLAREKAASIPLSERYNGLPEVKNCFSDSQAVEEAKRCLQCAFEIRLAEEQRK